MRWDGNNARCSGNWRGVLKESWRGRDFPQTCCLISHSWISIPDVRVFISERSAWLGDIGHWSDSHAEGQGPVKSVYWEGFVQTFRVPHNLGQSGHECAELPTGRSWSQLVFYNVGLCQLVHPGRGAGKVVAGLAHCWVVALSGLGWIICTPEP